MQMLLNCYSQIIVAHIKTGARRNYSCPASPPSHGVTAHILGSNMEKIHLQVVETISSVTTNGEMTKMCFLQLE